MTREEELKAEFEAGLDPKSPEGLQKQIDDLTARIENIEYATHTNI